MRYSLLHLHYFWHVARLGGVGAASKHLHITQSTVSGMVKQLERDLGCALFQRRGRNLVLTKQGELAKSYADEMFAIGQELDARFGGSPSDGRMVIRVGIEDVLPDLLVQRLLQPVYAKANGIRIECRDDGAAQLIADLANQRYDVILVDHAVTPDHGIRISNNQLGDSPTSILGSPAYAGRLQGRFPRNLSGQPFLMPSVGSLFARQLAQWLGDSGATPDIVGEVGDCDLMTVLAGDGVGACAVPTAVEQDACRRHGLQVIGRTAAVRVRTYAITTDRRLRHPGVKLLLDSARSAFAGVT